MTIRLAFHGGAGTVTGSRFLVTANGRRVLIDCGLFQGLKALRLKNWQPPAFDPRSVDAVVLTHAHIDHSGYLPRLVKEGFRGPIYGTQPTLELATVLLLDAAQLQEEDAAYANRKGFSKHHPALPLFDRHDAIAALKHMTPVGYDEWLELGEGVAARFHNAGHILGSAFVELRLREGETETAAVFSGDIGRYDMPLHVDPHALPACDTLVLESTYGDRLHEKTSLLEQVREPVLQAAARGGTILIPAFAVARVQLVTLMLQELIDAGELPPMPIHIDSPMAVEVTKIYGKYLETGELDEALAGNGRRGLFPSNVQFHRTVEESRALNNLPGPRIIISSSGMLTGGRVLHHLRLLLPNSKNLVALAGYQAVGTRGRALLEGATALRIHGMDVPVRSMVISIEGFSAHADAEELVRWAETAPAPPKTVFLAHGEPVATKALEQRLEGHGFNAVVPWLGQEFAFVPGSGRWRAD